MKSTLWGGRFAQGQDPAFTAFHRSLPFDRRLIQEDIAGSRAWARGLRKARLLTPAEQTRLDKALAALARRLLRDPSPLSKSQAEDVHSFVEAELVKTLGPLGKRLHTGRSRNDQVATDFRLFGKGACARLAAAQGALMKALVAFAERHADVAMPGYTHLQRAQPITVGHHALAYVEMLARDRGRLHDCEARMDECPLGSGALAGTGFPIDRALLARELGFARITRNSLDAVSDRDFVAELLFACGLCGVHLSRLCEDWIFMSSQEAAFLELSDQVCTGSSIMPQKKNPDALELIRGKSARLLGRLSGFLTCLKGLPLAYNKDLQEDKETLFESVDTLAAMLAVMTVAVRGAKVRRARMLAAAGSGFLSATDLADHLVERGVPFRDAHEQVGQVVRLALARGQELEQLDVASMRQHAPRVGKDIHRRLQVQTILARRKVEGGTAPARVRQEILRWKRALP